MSPKYKQYKDVWVAPGSDLYQALVDLAEKKDKEACQKKVKALYDDVREREKKLYSKTGESK